MSASIRTTDRCSRVPQSSRGTPPVYRRFLAGGAELLRLSLAATAVVVGAGVILLAAGEVISVHRGPAGPATGWPAVAAATLAAWLTAAVSARWLGSRLGALAGLVQLTGVGVLAPRDGAAVEILFCAVVSAAMGAFALANVPGRLPVVHRRWTGWAFYAAAGVSFVLGGPLGPAFILTGCVLFLALSADSRGPRFFASPVGIALFALIVGVRVLQPWGWTGVWVLPSAAAEQATGPAMSLPAALGSVAVAGLPWTPLTVLAVAIGLRRGHYATPVWRFFACWALGPLVLAAVGVLRSPSQLAPVWPPLAVMGAAGLSSVWICCRRRWRQF